MVPEGRYPEVGARIMNLQDPDTRMSTTYGSEQGTVYIVDEDDSVRKKMRSAVTDSGTEVRHDREQKPGITNLLEIMAVATGDAVPELEARYDGSGYGRFKEDVGEAVVELLVPIQRRYEELRGDEGELRRMLATGAEKARAESEPTLEQMYERMGFVRP